MALVDSLIALLVVLGVFAMFYMAWRQQGILDTINEIKEAFEDKAEDAKEALIYR